MPDPIDGLPAMVVGRWVTGEKHRIIKRYIDASWAARQKFTSQRTYIDLFAGTGRVKIKHTQTFQDGGPLAAWSIAQQRRGVFSDFFIADANSDFLIACDTRLRGRGAPLKSKVGRGDKTVDWVLPQLNKRGFHLALLDPFNAGHLHFSIDNREACYDAHDGHCGSSEHRRHPAKYRLGSRNCALTARQLCSRLAEYRTETEFKACNARCLHWILEESGEPHRYACLRRHVPGPEQ
ncbi:three-Cys-motif partner protein [Paraburkholderia sp. BL6669N2]|nr:three-Cys-motif partner protein [Paraburkholderia sp. BL6669N2]